MNRDVLRQVIIDQREMYMDARIVHRAYEIEEDVDCCFVGIRRAGKSTLMYQRIQELMDRGVPKEKILYVNFEDERLIEMKAADLNLILEIGYEISGGEKQYVFLDEIQNIDGWSKFARRIADQKYTVCITGSSSRMLSSEIAATLGGRYMIVPVYPYSFREYLAANGKEAKNLSFLGTKQKAEIMRLYGRYLQFGAFPELVQIKNSREYLNRIYQTIYLGDTITRNHISNSFAVRLMLKKVAESIGQPLSFTRIFNILTGAGLKISKQTVITYMDAALESCLLFPVQNYAAKLLEKETSPKYYFMDTGFPGLLLLNCDTAQLENLVAIELVRRYGVNQVYYFRKNVEIDFYVPEPSLAIQVCWSILQDETTKQRKTHSLAKFHQFMPDAKCVVITNSEKTEMDIDGIPVSVIPAWEWLSGE